MRTGLACFLGLLAWLLPLNPILAQGDSEQQAQFAREAFDLWVESGQFQGVALVADQGEIVMQEAFGPAVREWDVDHVINGVFPIASLSKQFTALLVLQLVQEGELSLDSTLGELLPAWSKSKGAQVTVQSLLTHSGGFRDPPFEHYFDPRHATWTDLKIATEYLDQSPDFVSGTQFRYSNADYHLLGAVLEAATGMSYGELIQERIAKPLGLQHTRLASRSRVVQGRPIDYVRPEANGPWIRGGGHLWSHWQAAGGLESSLLDLHRWNQALANFELLNQEFSKLMWTVPEQPGAYMALGSWVYTRQLPGSDVELRLVERRGAIGGFACLNAFDPDRKQWVILLSNHADRTLDTLSYAECLPLDLFRALNRLKPLGPDPAE